MAEIIIANASVEIPVYNSSTRSITNSLVKAATGGRISADKSGHVTVRALDSVNLNISSGDRLGILGHNGAGKSTLLRLLAGIYEPTSGSISRLGSISSLVDISMGINPENTGRENIFLRGKLMGMSQREIQAKISDIVEFAELGDFVNLPVRTYSSGMLLRLAFSVATAVQANILIMDEWLSVGDAMFAQRAESRLRELVDGAEILVVASHDHALLRSMTTHAVHLEGGRIRDIGETTNVLRDISIQNC